MLVLVDRFPEMLGEGAALAGKVDLNKYRAIKNIALAGMGGSAIAGDIVKELVAHKLKVPFLVLRNYNIPKCITKGSLVIVCSYSGNTEETLSAFKQAQAAGAKIIVITSGGKLGKLAQGLTRIIIPGGLPPRAALGYFLGCLLVLLNAGADIPKVKKTLNKLRAKYKLASRRLAGKLQHKLPLIFATNGINEAVGLRYKTQFNENGKVTAHLAVFPELDHNELESLAKLKKGKHDFYLLILRSLQESARMRQRINITRQILSAHMPVKELWGEGRSRIMENLSLINFGDYLSIYLAQKRGVDPTPVNAIEGFKRRLG